jgi:hypothetical protein
MDDKLVWTDTVSAFALHGVDMPKVLLRMWGHLRAAVLYFMRFQPNQHQPKYIDAAQDELLQYGRLAQETWNMQELMTFNLHTCMLHVPEQVRLCGALAFSAEWWLERLMQVFKRVTKYRCTRYPETTAVQHWLTVAALDDVRQRHPGITAMLDDIRVGRSTAAQDCTAGQSWLSGKLQKADSTVTTAVQEALESVERNHGGDGMRVTLELKAADLGRFKPLQVGPRGAGVPIVQLSMASTATIKGGRSLVSIKGKSGAQQNWHVLVPYTLEEPSPAAQAAEVARAAADATAELAAAMPGTSSHQSEADALAEVARSCWQLAQRHVAPSERSPGFNADAKAIGETLKKVVEAAQSTLALMTTSSSAVAIATRQAIQRCQNVAQELPLKCHVPSNPEPLSMWFEATNMLCS